MNYLPIIYCMDVYLVEWTGLPYLIPSSTETDSGPRYVPIDMNMICCFGVH